MAEKENVKNDAVQEKAEASESVKNVIDIVSSLLQDDDDSAQSKKEEKSKNVVDLTPSMVVSEGKKPEVEEEEEEDDFKPEPVIPSTPMKEETLDDIIEENRRNAEVKSENENVDSLLSSSAIESAKNSFSVLKGFSADDKSLSLGDGQITIEAIVKESLKPLLKEWLNANLPQIVEKVVKKEVANIIDRLDIK
ncbi:MAG: DUF2497 domain-containing protein [Alphaproteobacteria bacterium]|nr:DUF2497 domain-containing protein [Alphaproteobacteria bacterium]